MLSDSQASGPGNEYHGLQKLLPGQDFLLGGTGSVDIGMAVFDKIATDYDKVNAGNISQYLASAIDDMLEPAARQHIEFLVTTAAGVMHFQPGTFRQARQRGMFFTVGSGAEFVWRAYTRDSYLGIVSPNSTLADTFATVETLLDAADESLTVDDQLMLGIVANGRTYITGDKEISPRILLPPSLGSVWAQNVKRFESMRFLADQIRGELRESQRRHSKVREGMLGFSELSAIAMASLSVSKLRDQLNKELLEFISWYDTALGRS